MLNCPAGRDTSAITPSAVEAWPKVKLDGSEAPAVLTHALVNRPLVLIGVTASLHPEPLMVICAVPPTSHECSAIRMSPGW